MKQKILLRTLGCAAMMAASGLVACGDDSSSSPEPSSDESAVTEISSSVEQFSSSIVAESSSAMVVSSSLDALTSSSDIINESSSSVAVSSATVSSSSVENCIHMSETPPDSDSDPWCDNEGERSVDCLTQDLYICSGHLWERYGDRCVNISDSASGVSGASDDKWDCAYPDYTLRADCGNSEISYMCAAGMWIEAKDCDPSQERCGYSDTTLCTQFGIMEYCDGPSRIFPVGVPCNKPGKSVVIDGQWMYRCDNGKWHVVVPL